MKRLAACLLFILQFLALQQYAYAVTYQDHFADASQNSIKTYTNLAAFPMDGSYWSALPDRTAFSFASASTPTGAAVYRVQGAEQVVVGLYTLTGSFVCLDAGGQWRLGVFSEDTSGLTGQALPQAQYSPAARAVYCRIGGSMHKAYASDAGTLLQPTAESPGDLVGYALNIFTSSGGQSWSRVTPARTALQFRAGAPFVYEEYTAAVPASTVSIRIELNDVNGMEVWQGGGRHSQKLSGTYNCLASVAISGANLVVGAPEPLREESTPQEAASSESAASESRSSSQARASVSAGASSKESKPSSSGESARYSGAKFEGVIQSPQQSGASTRSAASSRSERAASSAVAAPPQEDPLPAEQSPIHYIPAKNDDDKHFTAGVTVYIIVVSVALCFVVLASAGKRK